MAMRFPAETRAVRSTIVKEKVSTQCGLVKLPGGSAAVAHGVLARGCRTQFYEYATAKGRWKIVVVWNQESSEKMAFQNSDVIEKYSQVQPEVQTPILAGFFSRTEVGPNSPNKIRKNRT
jgi:hypothetical protein